MAVRNLAIFGVVAALGLSGCAIHNWTPPAGEHEDIGVASAKCDLFAQSGGTETVAAATGSPKFVGISMGAMALAGAIDTAARQVRLYNDCMLASGWTPAR